MESSDDGKPKTFLIDAALLSAGYKCPVCYDIARPPIRACVEGHIICSNCLPRLNRQCPLCRRPISTDKQLALSQFAATFVVHPCLYNPSGCAETNFLTDIQQHEKICSFRPCSCPFKNLSCKWEGELDCLIPHIKAKHTDVPFASTKRVNLIISHTESLENSFWMIATFFHHRFFIVTVCKQKIDTHFRCDVIVQLVAMEKFCKDYRYTVYLKYKDNSAQKETTVIGAQNSIDQIRENHLGIVIDDREVLQYDANETLILRILIKKSS